MPAAGQGVPQVVPCQLSELAALSSVRIYISKDLRPLESRQLGLKVCLLTASFGRSMSSRCCRQVYKAQKPMEALYVNCSADCMQPLIHVCMRERGGLLWPCFPACWAPCNPQQRSVYPAERPKAVSHMPPLGMWAVSEVGCWLPQGLPQSILPACFKSNSAPEKLFRWLCQRGGAASPKVCTSWRCN